MLPVIPLALFIVGAGATVYTSIKAAKKHKLVEKTGIVLKRADDNYQQLVRNHVDPLFGSRQRGRQLKEFSGEYSIEEFTINRRLAFSVLNTQIAILAVFVCPPLLILNALGLIYLMGSYLFINTMILIHEKRVTYRLIASISIIANFVAGFYIIGSLMVNVVFLVYKLAARSEAYSRKSLMGAFALQVPETVWLWVDSSEIEIPFSKIAVGNVLVLNAGQMVPVDGCIVQGMATVDEHRLTGESQSMEKNVGDSVLASTFILTGKLHIRVEQTGTATAAAKIAEILDNTSNYRLSCASRSEQLADRLTLPMLGASCLALVSGIGIGGAVAILNSGFGSTMFVSGPLSMLSYLNISSHYGILIKDGRSLETLHAVDTVVFDKTGTLTMDQLDVVMIHCCEGWGENELLTLAATAEHRQTHPVARAIQAALLHHTLTYSPPDELDCALGFGVRAKHNHRMLHVGSKRFMSQEGIAIPEAVQREQLRCEEQGSSLVLVGIEGVLAGAIELQARLRPETMGLIQQLHARGLKLIILSGDHIKPTRHMAKRLGIDQFFAEVLPQGKSALIKKLQQEGRTICFVGDGINDAIALQQADVSVSLRGATTLATDSAQVVLTSGSLRHLDQLFEIAHDFNSNLNTTLRLAFVPGSILIGGVFLFHFAMGAALILYSIGMAGAIGSALYPMRQLKQESLNEQLEE